MPTAEKNLRVLIVDDNRDGADALGLVVEALGNQAHVTYVGTQALGVASAFRPDLMLIDLAMPEMDGCELVHCFRQIPVFTHTKIVAITGHADQGHRTMALKAGFDAVLSKPVALNDIAAVLAGVEIADSEKTPAPRNGHGPLETQGRLRISEARRIRSERPSKALTQAECEAAICEGTIRFQDEYMGWKANEVRTHLLNDLLVVRILGTMTLAERQLGKSSSAAKGRDLIKQVRKQLLEVARPMLESLVHEVTGVKVLSMHHDISIRSIFQRRWLRFVAPWQS